MTRLYQLGGGAAPSEGRMPALDYEPPLDTAVAQRAVAAGRELSVDSEARAVDQLHTISVLCSESADFLNRLGDDEEL